MRCLLRVEMPDDEVFAIWDDIGDIVVSGVTYAGKANRFTVQPAPASYDAAARPAIVTLSGLDEAAVALIDASPWHQRPIVIERAIIATESPAVLHLATEFSGRLDKMLQREKVGESYQLQFHCESAAIENTRSGGRTRSDADQRTRDPDDGFFSFAASAVTTTIDWGRNPQVPQQTSRGGIGRLFDKLF